MDARRAKYPRRPRRVASNCGSARVRPRQVRPSRVAPRDFTSESFRRNLFYTLPEISRHMKSHAVRPCARRRRSGCPFHGPPCRPGRRRTCVYGRNELHPSRHGRLTGLGGVRTPRAEGVAGTSRAGPVRTPRLQTRPNRLGAERPNRLVRKSRFPFCLNKAILSFDVQYQRRRT